MAEAAVIDPPTCPHCGAAALPTVTWQACGDGRRQVRADCQVCGRFLRALPRTAANVERADTADVVQPGLLDFLRAVGEAGLEPVTDGRLVYFFSMRTSTWTPALNAALRRHQPALARMLPRLRPARAATVRRP
jgi:hypothetical protein